MIPGEGKREVGESCWSHAQCYRAQANSHCKALICTCDKGFHTIGGRCSKNFWEDLGLNQWELMVVAFVLTLASLATLLGCMYFFLGKLARYHQTCPAEDLPPPEDSDQKGARFAQVVMDTQALRDGDQLPTVKLVHPAKFITPLSMREWYDTDSSAEYHSTSSRRSWFSDSTTSSGSSGGWTPAWSSSGGSSTSTGGWTSWARYARAWNQEPRGLLERRWHPPQRRYLRTDVASPKMTTRLPLLLRSATFSESDEST